MKIKFFAALFLTTILLYLYYFLEWLFFITKPSFLVDFTFTDHLAVLLVPPLPVLLLSLPLLMFFQVADHLIKKHYFTALIPAFVLTLICFMLVDNFTHTVFDFYVGSTSGLSRFGYFAGLLALFIFLYSKVNGWLSSAFWDMPFMTVVTGIVSLPAISLLIILMKSPGNSFAGNDKPLSSNQHPNILILSTDGLDSDHMSAYGYFRDTTPTITELINDSLLAENSFANSNHTTGSVASLLSGKLPTKTGVVFPPSVFQGSDVFEHFAGVLRKNGYVSLDIGVPYYADSHQLNMRDAFDVIYPQKQKLQNSVIRMLMPGGLAFTSETYFQELVIGRVASRVEHALFITDMIDVYQSVTKNKWYGWNDEKKTEQLLKFIKSNKNRSFFAHVHFMETHGPRFNVSTAKYSIGLKQENKWMPEFYDDTILNFDAQVNKVIHFLKTENIYENTVLIITSDHGTEWAPEKRLPLIFRFPNGQFSGRITTNTQRADIPPTLLDFIGIPIPEWMDGASIISGDAHPGRVVFSTRPSASHMGEHGFWRVSDYSAPFYSLGSLAIIQCQQLIQLNLSTGQLHKTIIKNHTDPCRAEMLLTEQQAYELIVTHLTNADYDMSGFIRH